MVGVHTGTKPMSVTYCHNVNTHEWLGPFQLSRAPCIGEFIELSKEEIPKRGHNYRLLEIVDIIHHIDLGAANVKAITIANVVFGQSPDEAPAITRPRNHVAA